MGGRIIWYNEIITFLNTNGDPTGIMYSFYNIPYCFDTSCVVEFGSSSNLVSTLSLPPKYNFDSTGLSFLTSYKPIFRTSFSGTCAIDDRNLQQALPTNDDIFTWSDSYVTSSDTTILNFTLSDLSYYNETCYMAGGQLYYITEINGECTGNTNDEEMVYNLSYQNVPFCIARTCSYNDTMIEINAIIDNYLNEFIDTSRLQSNNMNLECITSWNDAIQSNITTTTATTTSSALGKNVLSISSFLMGILSMTALLL